MNTKTVTKEIKQLIIKLVSLHIEFDDFDFSCVNKICTFNETNLGYIGMVKPLNINGRLEFEICLHTTVLNNIKNNKYIILHEFFHCKEMSITSQYIDWKRIYFSPIHFTTYDVILEFGYFQFSEYYAYYNCAKYNTSNIDLEKSVFNASVFLETLSSCNKDEKILLFNEAKDSIEQLAKNLVILIAEYHYSHNQVYVNEIEKFNTDRYKALYLYMKRLTLELPVIFEQYSNNMSEQFLVNYGKILYSMIHEYGLQYSSVDLSDNFELKK